MEDIQQIEMQLSWMMVDGTSLPPSLFSTFRGRKSCKEYIMWTSWLLIEISLLVRMSATSTSSLLLGGAKVATNIMWTLWPDGCPSFDFARDDATSLPQSLPLLFWGDQKLQRILCGQWSDRCPSRSTARRVSRGEDE